MRSVSLKMNIDLNSLSTEELKLLKKEVDAEVKRRTTPTINMKTVWKMVKDYFSYVSYADVEWKKEIKIREHKRLVDSFESFQLLVQEILTGKVDARTNREYANVVTDAYVTHVDRLYAEKEAEIKSDLPPSKIKMVYNPETDKYEAVYT